MKQKNYIQFGIGLMLIFASLTAVAFFGVFEDATWTKLWVLLGTIAAASVGLALIFEQKSYAISISRFFTGILFVFSGFVKAVDPLGSNYKFIDYFTAWNMDFLAPAALTLGIIMSTAELLVGLCLLFKIYPKLSSLGALIFMLGFTPVTLYLAFQQNITGKELVHDCGCFGDALVLTNWQTFVKNIFILVPVAFLFFCRKKIQPSLTPVFSLIATIVLTLSIVGLSAYALIHLPPIDFRPYKIGTQLVSESCGQSVAPTTKTYMYAEFVNNQTGERKEFEITENYPDWEIWDIDTLKPYRNEIIRLKTEEKVFKLDPFFISSQSREDYTCNIITDTSFVFLLVQYDIKTSCTKNAQAINALYDWAQQHDFAFYGLTASLAEDVAAFREKTQAQYEFLIADPIALKTIVRANPGLVVLKNGVVIANWNGNDIPPIAKFEKLMLNNK
ncbi:MAG: DoxX family protein [Bacteroidetes bacterium]|nr:DoxX family protein [Bacteroidota bacterium]